MMKKDLLSVGLCAATIGASFLLTTPVSASTNDQNQSNEPKQEVVAQDSNKQEAKHVAVTDSANNQQSSKADNKQNPDTISDEIADKIKRMTEQESKHLNEIVAGMSEEDKKNLVDHLYSLDKPDELSEGELKEKGLNEGVYISNGNDTTSLPKGAKFRIKGKATVYGQKAEIDSEDPTNINKVHLTGDFDKPLFSVEFVPHHHRDGSIYTIDELCDTADENDVEMMSDPRADTDDNFKNMLELSGNVGVEIYIVPLEKGKTIYVDINHKLNSDDLNRGFIDSDAPGTSEPKWNIQSIKEHVDLSKTGRYEGAFGSVIFGNGTGTTFGVPVVVCDPEGKTFHLKVNDNVPELSEAVTVDPIKNSDADYSGLKLTWENPDRVKNDMKAAGTYQENVLVTYPDGSKGKNAVVTIIVADDGKKDKPQVPTPTPNPDPEPTPDPMPTPEPAPTPNPEVPATDENKGEDKQDDSVENAPVHSTKVDAPEKKHETKKAVIKKTAVKNVAAVKAAHNDEQHAELPQTGEKTSFASVIGMAIAVLSGLLFFDKKRKQN